MLWQNTTNETVLLAARAEIWGSWRRTCLANVDHPRAKELFDRYRLPAFHDPSLAAGRCRLRRSDLASRATPAISTQWRY